MADILPRGASGRTARAIAIIAARRGGEIARGHFGSAKAIRFKGRGNLVTQADLDSEQAILTLLRSEFPTHGLISEESPASSGDSPYSWVVDPIDGTTNFAAGLPLFAVSIALVHGREPVLGVIYEPLRRELFVAEKGRGATLGGRPIHVGAIDALQNAVGAFDLGYEEQARRQAMATATAIRQRVMTLRLIGSAVLGQAYVACGRFDFYFHCFLYPWDVAAGQLIAREAGAMVTDWRGQSAGIDTRELMVANGALHDAVSVAVSSLPLLA